MIAQVYPPARSVAGALFDHFGRYIAAAGLQGREDLAVLPEPEVIEAIIDTAFWASLRREEGYVPRISLAFLPPTQTLHPLLFERPLPFTPAALTHVAPAVERPGIHLGVWRDQDGLCVWGTTRLIPSLCFVLEVAAPGLLVIKHHRGEEAVKFVNVAVLEGDQIKLVDETASSLPGCPSVLTSLLGTASAPWLDPVNVLVQLAVSMRAHRRGGSLLVVPSGSDRWRDSIVQPVSYSVQPPFSELAGLVRETPLGDDHTGWQEALGRSVEAVAGLTAVDGATLLTDQYELLAFGAKIGRRDGWPPIERLLVTEPVVGTTALVTHPAQLGGTRHLSAAQFVQDQRDGVALVASQDGRFTVFSWTSCEDMVHAHRIETLLL